MLSCCARSLVARGIRCVCAPLCLPQAACGRACPIIAISFLLAIHRFDSANSVITFTVFLTTIEDVQSLWPRNFPARDDRFKLQCVEFATLDLARRCGLNVTGARLEVVGESHVLMRQRFDRDYTDKGYPPSLAIGRARHGHRIACRCHHRRRAARGRALGGAHAAVERDPGGSRGQGLAA